MSVVSGVTLVTWLDETEPLNEINAWLVERSFAPLKQVDDYYSGSKHPQCDVFGAGFNFFFEDEFAEFVLSREWEHPDRLVLVVQPEEGTARVFRPERWA